MPGEDRAGTGRNQSASNARAHFAGLAARILKAGESHPWLLLAVIQLIWLPAAIGNAVTRRLWYDELFTLNLGRLGTLVQLWQALRSGVDLQPPLSFAIVHVCESWLGANELGVRAPSILFFVAVTVFLFVIGRNAFGTWYGALCTLMLLVSAGYPYSSEARPYAMLLAFSSAALWCWIRYGATGRWAALAGFAVAIALTVSTQYYGALTVIPFWAGEAYAWSRKGRMDWKVLAASLAGLAPVLFFYPLIRSAVALHGQRPWNPVMARTPLDIYSELIAPMAVPVFLAAILLFLIGRRKTARAMAAIRERMTVQTVVIACYIAIPVPALAAAYFGSHMIYWRYLMPAVMGLVLITAQGLHSIAGGGRGAAAFGSLFCLTWFVYLHGRDYQKVLSHAPPPGAITLPAPVNDEPVVVNSPLDFVPLVHYADAALRRRLVYVADPDFAARIAGTDAVEKNIISAAPYFSLRVISLREFRERFPDFALYVGPSTVGWFAQQMIDEGALLKVYSRSGWNLLYQGHIAAGREPR